MTCQIDHLVIGAKNLDDGITYVKKALGVDIPFGGVHLSMGTHNALMQLGDTLFLEVIAVNAEIPPPVHPRWYGLDDPFVRQRLEQGPVLLTWVVNSQSIDGLLRQAGFDMGNKQRVCRGQLSWYFSLPDDGRLLAGGLLPYGIEWHTKTHPAANMQDTGCRLLSLTLHHSQAKWLQNALASIDASDLVTVVPETDDGAPFLVAKFNTPSGEKIISSRGE